MHYLPPVEPSRRTKGFTRSCCTHCHWRSKRATSRLTKLTPPHKHLLPLAARLRQPVPCPPLRCGACCAGMWPAACSGGRPCLLLAGGAAAHTGATPPSLPPLVALLMLLLLMVLLLMVLLLLVPTLPR